MSFKSFVRTHAVATAVALVLAGTAGVASVRISQVYPGGGNTGATYNQDFVELYNDSASPADISGWSIQYASAAGTTVNTTFGRASIPAATTINANSFFLIGTATAGTVGVALPPPDFVVPSGLIAMGAAGGKVILVNTDSVFVDPTVTSGGNVVDYVGYGTAAHSEGGAPAPAPSNNTESVHRLNGGLTDTGNNAADFQLLPVHPRNMTSVNDWMAY